MDFRDEPAASSFNSHANPVFSVLPGSLLLVVWDQNTEVEHWKDGMALSLKRAAGMVQDIESNIFLIPWGYQHLCRAERGTFVSLESLELCPHFSQVLRETGQGNTWSLKTAWMDGVSCAKNKWNALFRAKQDLGEWICWDFWNCGLWMDGIQLLFVKIKPFLSRLCKLAWSY